MTELYRKCGECKGEGFTFKDTTFQGAKFQTARKCPANCTRGFVPVEAVEVTVTKGPDGRLVSVFLNPPLSYKSWNGYTVLPASLVLHAEVGDG